MSDGTTLIKLDVIFLMMTAGRGKNADTPPCIPGIIIDV